MTTDTQICPLCEHCANPVEADEFFQCDTCQGVFRLRKFHLSSAREKERYLEHNKDVHDAGYRQFVFPITHAILKTYDRSACGLDFGAGSGPVISEVLQEQGYPVVQYDPFFSTDPSPQKQFLINSIVFRVIAAQGIHILRVEPVTLNEWIQVLLLAVPMILVMEVF